MLIVSICAKNYQVAFEQIKEARRYPVDAVELRLDYFERLSVKEIKEIKKHFDIPMIFTLRNKSQGGIFKGTEKERLKLIENLFSLEPEYFDLEYNTSKIFIKKLSKQYPKVTVICSYHNFKNTPVDLSKILSIMRRNIYSIYKIACKANSIIDSLRMLQFVKNSSEIGLLVAGICMGDLGRVSRILSPIFKSRLNYACLTDSLSTADGQITIAELCETYNYRFLDVDTKIYALLGDPVAQSVGHIFHNSYFKARNINAVYVKLKVKTSELFKVLQFIKDMPFRGVSVTMPHKEAVISMLDKVSDSVKHIGAVNTILIKEGNFLGFNTDGIGALNVLESKEKGSVSRRQIIIIGAGGTASAIAYEALLRNAYVIILNRTKNSRKKLAKLFACSESDLDYLGAIKKIEYLINATSVGMDVKDKFPADLSGVDSNTIVLDVVMPKKNIKTNFPAYPVVT